LEQKVFLGLLWHASDFFYSFVKNSLSNKVQRVPVMRAETSVPRLAPQAGGARITPPWYAAKLLLVPVQSKPASPPKTVTATAPSQLGAAILAAHSGRPFSNGAGRKAQNRTGQHCPARKRRQHSFKHHLQGIGKATGHKLAITFSHDA
jgi:hypothetical protein